MNASSLIFAQTGSSLILVVIALAVLIGIAAAVVLVKTGQSQKEMDINVLDIKKIAVDTAAIPNAIREKVKKLPIRGENSEETVKAISKMVEEQTQQMLQDIKDEYSVKYQVIEQKKNKEVEVVKKEYEQVKEKYDEASKKFKKSEEEKRQTDAVVKSIAEGLVVVNQKGEVLLMNPTAEKLLGVDKKKKIGTNIMDNASDELMISLSRPAGEGGDKVIEYKAKDENVKKILRSSSAVIQNENGETVGMVNILTDVTKQKELDEIKTKFLSNVTHELRTPIVAMQKSIAILTSPQAGSLNETQQNFLNIISRNMGHLSRLVEDLLDVAKIEAGKMQIKPSVGRVEKVIGDACETLDTWAKSKNIQIVREVDKSLPEFSFDPGRITQVLHNLISNAIKFTPSGGKITVKSAWSKDMSKVQVSVIDTGVGIAKEDQKKLFGRFEQFGDQQGIMGTGLGLSITKEIVERHGGEISVESEAKKGATFMFALPIKPARIT